MANIVVLGCGMVGSAIAKDLVQQHNVLAIDSNAKALQLLGANQTIQTQLFDVNDSLALQATLKSCDLAINAVPGFLGFATLKTIIDSGKNVVDIAFYPEDALSLNQSAKDQGVTAIVDMGVAPGMSNLILGHHNAQMTVQDFKCYVGGLPKVRSWPFAYKAPFSPVDVIEEYTRPARLMEHGMIVEKPALSDRELMEFKQIGTLEAFNTDGLRSLLSTMQHIPNMAEKTLRYPGHVELILALQHSGFFQQQTIEVKGQTIRPIDVTADLLKRQWRLNPGEKEFTLMRIIILGLQNNVSKQITYELFDEYDETTQTSSMARTTGYACAAAANLILSGQYTQSGISPPEYIGKNDACFQFIMDYLKDRNVLYTSKTI